MRVALALAMLLLAGCAETQPPPGGPAATPTPPTPADEAWVEANGSWTYEVVPSRFEGVAGEAVPFRATVRHAAPPEATFRLALPWVDGDAEAEVRGPATTIEGSVYLGLTDSLRAGVVEHEAGGVGFEGPPLVALGIERAWPLERRSDVSDDPPGASLRAEGERVRFTYATERNATTTADAQVRAATQLRLVRDADERILLAFVEVFLNDAVAPLDAPQRPRLVAEIPREELPEGDVTLRVVTRTSCFCHPQPRPEVEERVVQVPPPQDQP